MLILYFRRLAMILIGLRQTQLFSDKRDQIEYKYSSTQETSALIRSRLSVILEAESWPSLLDHRQSLNIEPLSSSSDNEPK